MGRREAAATSSTSGAADADVLLVAVADKLYNARSIINDMRQS